jgi:hypothetical protein
MRWTLRGLRPLHAWKLRAREPERVTANGMAQVEELFSELDAANEVVQ